MLQPQMLPEPAGLHLLAPFLVEFSHDLRPCIAEEILSGANGGDGERGRLLSGTQALGPARMGVDPWRRAAHALREPPLELRARARGEVLAETIEKICRRLGPLAPPGGH